MPTIGHSEHVPMGEYVIAKTSDDGEVQYIMQATRDLAYSLFGAAILHKLRLDGEQGWVLINSKDWKNDYWKIKIHPEDEE